MKKFLTFIIILLLSLIGLTLYAYYSSYYTVAFIVDGVATKEKVKKNANLTNKNIPEKTGYKFLYWMDDYTIVDDNYTVKNDAVLIALFEKVIEKKTYTVKFDTDGGSDISKRVVVEDEKLIEPDKPTKEGYIFKEWLLDDVAYDFDLPVTKDITLKASYIKESAKTYMVSFDTDGGSRISSKTVEENAKVNRPANPYKTGYKFLYWTLNGKTYNFNTPITKNITLKAVYQKEEKKAYTVTFDSAGGTDIPSQSVVDGMTAVKPTNPEKTGYTFANWLLDNNAYDFSTKVTKNITLKAVYVKLNEESTKNSYVVSFNTNGGNKIDYQVVEENGKATKPADPVKAGATFKEWQLNGETYDFNTPVTSLITLIAVYEENTIKATNLTLSSTSHNMKVGDTFVLKTTVAPSNTTNKVTWTSSDNTLATVSNGEVKALKEGIVKITAKIDDLTKECEITISKVEYKYEIINNYIYIKSGSNYVAGSLTITYSDSTTETINVPKSGYLLPDKNVVTVTNITVS